MTDRRLSTDVRTSGDAGQPASKAPVRQAPTPVTPLRARLARPRSPEEAEERYLACRNEWTAAMRAAGSGKPADLAALAMAQQAYEEALTEHQRWQTGPRVAKPVQPDRPRGIDAVVGQELSWRRIHEQEQEKPRGLRRFFGRGKKG
jgi:hypothetical protein